MTAPSMGATRTRTIRLLLLAAALWGLTVALHVLGAPWFRMLRIPGATGLAPVSVQRALDGMTAKPDDARYALEGRYRDYDTVDAFADAGPRQEIEEVKGWLIRDHAIAQQVYDKDGYRRDWKQVTRRAFTPTGADAQIQYTHDPGPGPCNTTPQTIVEWEGVYVDGDRALALTRERSDCTAAARPKVTPWQYALRRIDRKWLIEEERSRPYPGCCRA